MRPIKRFTSPFAVVSLAILLGLGSGLPAAHGLSVTTLVVASRSQYVPGDNRDHLPVVAIKGGKILFRNADPFAFGPHTLTADGRLPNGAPLFDSGDVGNGKSATINISTLKPGTYTFHCNHHLMFGTLRVVG